MKPNSPVVNESRRSTVWRGFVSGKASRCSSFARAAALVSLSFNLALAQEPGWFQPAPPADARVLLKTLRQVRILDGRTILAAGLGGIAKSTDWGRTWRITYATSCGEIGTLSFVDSTIGWAGGSCLLKTTDGGESWTRCGAGIPGGVTSLDFVDRDLGWAVTSREVYKTTDSGITWTHAYTISDRWPHFMTIQSFGRTEAIASGGWTWHVRTTDGGRTWANLDFGTNTWVNDLVRAGESTAYAVGEAASRVTHTCDGWGSCWTESEGDHAAFWKTTDGGASWKRTVLDLHQSLRSAWFASPDEGVVVGEKGTIIRTTDGGASWWLHASGTAYDLYQVTSSGGKRLLSGGDGSTLLQSSDAGVTWASLFPSTGTAKDLRTIQFLNAANGWGLSSEGPVIHTADGGSSWQPVLAEGWRDFADLFFYGEQFGWAVGNYTFRTTDGGATWQNLGYQGGSVSSVRFIDAQKGWTVGTQGKIRRTTDGGRTWSDQASGTSDDLRCIRFASNQVGWIVGGKTILKTTDGGESWQSQPTGVGDSFVSLNACAVLDNLTGWVAGYAGLVLRTTDGGASWQPGQTRVTTTLNALAFIDAQTGWAVGERNTLLKSTDGGQTWNPQTSPVDGGNLSCAAFLDFRTGWIGGSAGVILKTLSSGEPHSLRITSQPADQTAAKGATVQVSVTAAGSPPLSYQWFEGSTGEFGRPLVGAVGSAYTTEPLASNTKLWVKVSNLEGSIFSDTADLTVLEDCRPFLEIQPPDATTLRDRTATFAVMAGGCPSLSYQWYEGSSGDTSRPISGATSDVYTTPPLPAAATYWVRITNQQGSVDSRTVTVTVHCPPGLIITQPQGAVVQKGVSVQLSVSAFATQPVTYQWYVGNSGDVSAPISGATSAAYTTQPLNATTTLWVRVTDYCSQLDSQAAAITVVDQCAAPAIQKQPEDAAIIGGQSATLSVEAWGCTPLAYQWYRGNSGNTSDKIWDATSDTYTTPALIKTSTYWVEISNAHGAAQSRTVTVNVDCPVGIAVHPQSVTILKGATTTLTVTASGLQPISYQWYRGNSGNTSDKIWGATSDSYTTSSLSSTASFWVRVTNICGAVDSQTAVVTVICPVPAITVQPRASTIETGQSAQLEVTASNQMTGTLTYRWYQGQSGDTSRPVGYASVLKTAALKGTTSFWVRVSNACGSVDSRTALVTVRLAGCGWQTLGPQYQSVTALAVHPQESRTVYAGSYDKGIYRTTDGGRSWTLTLDRSNISAFAFPPGSPGIVYAAVRYSGVYRSTDGGVRWSSHGSGGPTHDVRGVLVDPQNALIMYATAYYNGVYKSTDAGGAWTPVNNGLPSGSSKYVTSLVLDPGNTNSLYASTGYDGVFKSTDGGSTWTPANTGLTNKKISRITLDPSNPAVLYAATESSNAALFRSENRGDSWTQIYSGFDYVYALAKDVRNGAALYAGTGAGLLRSTDGGSTWSAAGAGLADLKVNCLAFDPRNPQAFYAGADENGVLKSSDGAATWLGVNSGLGGRDVYAFARHPSDPAVIFAGTGDGFFKTTDSGGKWTRPVTGLKSDFDYVYDLSADPTNGNILYARASSGVHKSTNGGVDWSKLAVGQSSINAMALDPQAPAVLYCGGSWGVAKSTDGGGIWGAASTAGLGGASIRKLLVAPNSSLTIYAGASGGLFKSTDGGATWQGPAATIGTSQVYALAIDALAPLTVYAATSSDLFKSTNGGADWSKLSDPAYSYETLVCDPRFPGTVYVGYSSGVFKSTDGGSSWFGMNAGLTDLQIKVLTVDPHTSDGMFAGTYYGGGYRLGCSSTWLFPYDQTTTSDFTGFAVSNPSALAADLLFTGYKADGALLGNSDNPSARTLNPSAQLALLGDELLGAPVGERQPGWVEMVSTRQVGAFFQVGRWDGQHMDGSVAFQSQSEKLYFTRVFQGPNAFRGQTGLTRLAILNPNVDPVTLRLRVYGPTPGQQLAPEQTRTLPGKGYMLESVARIFGDSLAVGSGFITAEVTAGVGAAGFELIEFPEPITVVGLNASFGNWTGRLYSAQLVNALGFFTNIKLLNPSSQTRTATLSAVYDDGSAMAPPVVVPLQPGQIFERDAGEVFAFSGGRPAIGTLRVEADGPELIGDVIFGEVNWLRFAAALPLQADLFTEAVFSQVANGLGYYTGMAFHNPASQPADVTIEVYTGGSVKTGERQLQLGPGARLAQLLWELVPETAGQVGGYIMVRSTQPLIAQLLLGDYRGNLLSAVPPTVLK